MKKTEMKTKDVELTIFEAKLLKSLVYSYVYSGTVRYEISGGEDIFNRLNSEKVRTWYLISYIEEMLDRRSEDADKVLISFNLKDLELIYSLSEMYVQVVYYNTKDLKSKKDIHELQLRELFLHSFILGYPENTTFGNLVDLLDKFKQILFMEASFNGKNLAIIEDLMALNIFNAESSPCLKSIKHINRLYLQNQKRKSFPDLDHLEYIEALYLRNNEISDISKISHLTSLKILDLSNNYISNLKPLKKLTHLEELYLDGNRIYDLTPLKNLKNLKILNLSDNFIVKLKPLENLEKLEVLYLVNNKIKHDYHYVLYLKSIKELNLNNNSIQELFPLAYEGEKSSLLSLSLRDNKIFDVEFDFEFDMYQEMGENVLEELFLSKNVLENTDFLKDLPKLKKLDISMNRIRNINYLNQLTELEELDFYKNKIKEVEWLENTKPVNELKIIKSLKLLNMVGGYEKSKFLKKVEKKEVLLKRFKEAGIDKEKRMILVELYESEMPKELQNLGFSKTQIADMTNRSLKEVERDLRY